MTQDPMPEAIYELVNSRAITPEAMRVLRAVVRAGIAILIYGHNESALQYFGDALSALSGDAALPVYRLADDGETITTRKMILLYGFFSTPPTKDMLLFMARHYRVRLLIHFEEREDKSYEVQEILQQVALITDSIINPAASSTLQTLYERYQPSNTLKSTGIAIDFKDKLVAQDLDIALSNFELKTEPHETSPPDGVTEDQSQMVTSNEITNPDNALDDHAKQDDNSEDDTKSVE